MPGLEAGRKLAGRATGSAAVTAASGSASSPLDLIEGRDLLCLGGGEWDVCPREPDFLKVLAEEGRNRVLLLESPGMRRPEIHLADLRRILDRLKRLSQGVRSRGEGVRVVTPATLPFPGSRLVRRLNAVIQRRALRRVMAELAFRDPILLITSPIFLDLLDLLPASLVVYDCFDEWRAFPGVDGELFGHLERDVMRRADVVLAASEPLARAKADLREDIQVFRNAVDPAAFAGPLPPEPPALAAIPRPRLGYVGNIYARLDLDLVAGLARRRPEWSIVLVGLVRAPLGPLEGLPNVHVLGVQPKPALPCYVRHLDLGLLPHRSTDLTERQDPTKLYEYLAAGLPVVATDLEPVRAFGALVRRASGLDATEEAIAEELADDDGARRDARRAAVAAHTWKHRAGELSEHIRRGLAHRRLDPRGPG